MNVLLLPLPLLFLLAAAASQQPQQQYFELLPNYTETHSCLCQQLDSEFDFACRIWQLNSTKLAAIDGLPCAQLPGRVINSLTLDCANCRGCAVVRLDALTETGTVGATPPLLVSANDCYVGGYADADDAAQTHRAVMSIAQLGPPENAGVGGYFTTEDPLPADSADDCRLLELNLTTVLKLDSRDNFTRVRRSLARCSRLSRIRIDRSPELATLVALDNAAWLSSLAGGGGGGVAVELIDSNLTDADAANSARAALASLNACLTAADPAAVCVGDSSSQAWSSGLTRLALNRLVRLRPIGSLASLYSQMDNETLQPAVRFSLLLGHRWLTKDAEQLQPRSSSISSLNLSGNQLTDFPAGLVGLLEGLNYLDLSRNRIVNLFSSETCELVWPHRCYWFRAVWMSLRVLDLSNNRIEAIGRFQPWHEVSLNVLYLQRNRISRLDPLALSSRRLTANLMSLNLDDNWLTAAETSCNSLRQLRSLSLQRNRLSRLTCSQLLPQTDLLSAVLLNDNNISEMQHGCLLNLTGLQLLNLSGNRLKHFDHRSLKMQPRQSAGARASLAADNQQVKPICDCRHTFARVLAEEEDEGGALGFAYPDWLNRRNCSCLFYEEDSEPQSQRLGRLSDARPEEFLCKLGKRRQALPHRFCPVERNCTAQCLSGCACYRGHNWLRVSLLCRSSAKSDPAASPPIDLPADRVDLSGLPAGRLRRVSRKSLRWSSPGVSAPLTVLMLNLSGVETVDPDALDFNQSIRQLWLNNNSLASLDPVLFNRLASARSVWLSGNPWRCSCDPSWLTLHRYLNRTASSDQTVADFELMECTFSNSFLRDYRYYRAASLDTSLGGVAASRPYGLNDAGRLLTICDRMPKFWRRRQQQMAEAATLVVAIVLLAGLAWRLLRLRHSVLLRLRLRLLRTAGGQSVTAAIQSVESFDVMLWTVASDQDRLAEVAAALHSALAGLQEVPVDICVHCHGGQPAEPLPDGFALIDSPADGVRLSACIVVLLSDAFWTRQRDELRRLLRLSNNASAARNRPRRRFFTLRVSGSGGGAAAEPGLKRLAGMSDGNWRHRLVAEILRPRGGLLRLCGQRLGILMPRAIKQMEELGEPAMNDDGSKWPPFRSADPGCADILVLCWPGGDCPDTAAALRRLADRLPADTQPAINAQWSAPPPAGWQVVDLSSAASPRLLLRRYRQVVVIATDSLLDWLRTDQPELLAELELLLIGGRQFNRRVVLAGVGRIDGRERLGRLADGLQRLPELSEEEDEENELVPKFWRTALGEEISADWLDTVLYRPQQRRLSVSTEIDC